MKENENITVQEGSNIAPPRFYIRITTKGPYLVYGNPPVNQEIIVPNEEGASWEYRKGKTFDYSANPIKLCRCGNSRKKPYCDGSHALTAWNPEETNDKRPLLDDAKVYPGPSWILEDNEEYCVHARFCTTGGPVWDLVTKAETTREKELVRHQAEHCPAGRLVLVNRETNAIYEPALEPAIGVIQDSIARLSGPLWVKGGIRVQSADGEYYEVRNRVTLCRCGMSTNKPFCDGMHTVVRFRDGLSLDGREG